MVKLFTEITLRINTTLEEDFAGMNEKNSTALRNNNYLTIAESLLLGGIPLLNNTLRSYLGPPFFAVRRREIVLRNPTVALRLSLANTLPPLPTSWKPDLHPS